MPNSLERWFDRKSLSPFNWDQMWNEMSALRGRELPVRAFSPSCDVSEDASQFTFKFDLPGVKKENVKVEIDNNNLTVSAERKEEKTSDNKKQHLSEVYYGSYVRSFSLPQSIDSQKVQAQFADGVLTVTVSKMSESKSKQITVS